MGFLDELKKLTRPYDDEDEEFIDEVGAAEAPIAEKRPNPFANFGSESSAAAPVTGSTPARPKSSGRVVSLNSVGGGNGQMKVIVVRPERFEVAAQIADHLRNKHAIVMNLENTPKDVSRRLTDFISGVAYALDGQIKKVAANTYIITPYNVDLTGDQMDELETGSAYL